MYSSHASGNTTNSAIPQWYTVSTYTLFIILYIYESQKSTPLTFDLRIFLYSAVSTFYRKSDVWPSLPSEYIMKQCKFVSAIQSAHKILIICTIIQHNNINFKN